ncbi:DEAD/DEAH box helicase [Oscillatoria sp. FACHB-1407]|uniref:DEAD/DEAH box helicase n=1 Tax=Oscillatoria sp. FACHB-1407 TaxID=2692847 RepID=UPI001683A596|nr:DEAD/DEAH box helicase [Oscillatoria sp. FACHB-1407]MBD2463932.1 DEAD/DEAH box helicase [Oscillatoria sp. FACHB-1407]
MVADLQLSPWESSLSQAQQEILQSGLLTSGFNCILQMPTGSGKTWLAEQAIAHTLNQNRRAIYLTPLRALASELTTRWQKRFAPNQVGIFTGDYANSNYPVSYQNAQLLVMTPEKLDVCTRNWRNHWSWLPDVDLVVVDEFHLLGDSNRGARLEAALLRFMRLNPFVRVIGLSATLGNRQELADWLRGLDYCSNQRVVPLQWNVVRYKRAQDKPDLLIGELQRNLATGGKSLVFVQSRRRAEWLAQTLQEAGFHAAHHHAGLDRSSRSQIETQFRNGNLDVLIATATLEMGLNLPARQVVLYDLQGFDGTDFVPLPVNNVWQRAGRAGRPGLDPVGEVVLLAPVWDRQADHYAKGQFEPIRSGLSSAIALAEQVITEIASGLCRTHAQLEAVFSRTLAAVQNRLSSIDRVVDEMLQAGMLVQQEVSGYLQATRLGFIAVRHLISPATVQLFQRVFQEYPDLTFLDLLLIAVSSIDCQPLIPVDYEQLDELATALSTEPSVLLTLPQQELSQLLGIDGKQLLAAMNTALVARTWTRLGDAEQVAEMRGCYAFEVQCLCDSVQRLLLAMKAILQVLESEKAIAQDPERVPLIERIGALERMVSGGLDEGAATLTLIRGIGAKTAKRLKQAGIADIEDLALAELEELVAIPGISEKRATQWLEQALEVVGSHSSAFRYREEPTQNLLTRTQFPIDIDPYRLRRAMDLRIVNREGTSFRVVGGTDPHTVTVSSKKQGCDCPDSAKGHTCKHILAVLLHLGDKTIRNLVQALSNSVACGLDLLQLWVGTPLGSVRWG